MKKVGILGSGIVGKTLASGFLKYDYEVMIATRDNSKLAEWLSEQNGNVQIGSFEETAQFANFQVLAVKGTIAEELIRTLSGQLAGKVVVDATNPIAEAPPENGVLRFFTSLDRSLMEILQDTVPSAHFVKAFSCIGSAHMINPQFELNPSMFICGNDEAAKEMVSEILDLFGFETEDMGTAEAARAIEPLCMLWCIPGFTKGQWGHAFRLMKS